MREKLRGNEIFDLKPLKVNGLSDPIAIIIEMIEVISRCVWSEYTEIILRFI